MFVAQIHNPTTNMGHLIANVDVSKPTLCTAKTEIHL